MKEEIREKIALKRYQIISPVLAEPRRAQNEYFRKQADIEHDFPHYGVKKIGVSTMKSWLRTYRKEGFEGLKPNPRADKGRPRRLNQHMMDAVSVTCKACPHWRIQNVYEHLLAQDLLGDPPIHYNTLRRVIKDQGLLAAKARADVRKAYEVDAVNDLWVCDYMHGPKVHDGKSSRKAILCATIDDHSRMVVGHAFNTSETISSLTVVLKEAFMSYGIPKRLYVDNGPSFSSDLLVRACAMAGISLTHSKPYDSPSRGKIERFFRTVRDRFLSGVQNGISLDEINEAFYLWLKEDYHHKLHSGIKARPIDRYHVSLEKTSIPPGCRPYGLEAEGFPRQSWTRSFSCVTKASSTTIPKPLSRAPSMRCPPHISARESRYGTLSMTRKTSISTITISASAPSNWWTKRRTPAYSGLRTSPPTSPFTKGGSHHERYHRMVRSQTHAF